MSLVTEKYIISFLEGILLYIIVIKIINSYKLVNN